ncbi:MAG: T9SS type A sorting domain-containing protein [Raineya sp.]|nr:T9SS type A sorting domain-containing protein [Raineya sp.]
MKLFLFYLCILPFFCLGQQYQFQFDNNHQVEQNGIILQNPWAGGLNSPQISSIDLNMDGVLDIFVYDRTNQKIYTFIANSSLKKYIYQPEYESLFPDLNGAGWVLLHDYNNDNKKDIFVGYNFGVQAYKNTSSSILSFTKQYELLETESAGIPFKYNLSIFNTDVPAFQDIDTDGDLDALFLDFHNGQIELHLNRSKERYGNTEFLEFEQINYCWGDFLIQEINCDDIVFNIACPFNNLKINDGRQKISHTGASVLIFDINGDGLQDLFVSGVSCNKTYVMINQGTNKGAVFRSFTSQYPTSFPINLGIFTALYAEDVTFDGKKDLIATSNLYENENNLGDFSQSVWLYNNVGSHSIPEWNFSQKDFLQKDMIDIGQGASVSFVDIDGDTDLDLFLGNEVFLSKLKPTYATLRFYRNQGNKTQAKFVLEDEDFMQLSKYKFLEINPQWKDLNNDGSMDLGFTSTDSTNKKTIFYFFSNNSPKNQIVKLNPQLLPYPISLEKGDKPYFYDINSDGNLDVFNIKPLGNIIFLEKNKNGYTEKVNNVLNIQISAQGRNPSITIADFDLDGTDDLAFINNFGFLEIYSDIKSNYNTSLLPQKDIIKNVLQNTISKHFFGNLSKISNADLNGDRKPDLVIGTHAGGIQILSNTLLKDPLPLPKQTDLILKPNPVRNFLYIEPLDTGTIEIYNCTGQILFSSKTENDKEIVVNVESWASGLYIARLKNLTGVIKTAKFVKINN